MDKTVAWARLKAMTVADSAPTLSADELEALLAMNQVADSADLPPADASWNPTWDLNRAAAEGWRWKAGKAAGNFDFTADGSTFNRAQIVDHCEKMAAQYARKIAGSVPVYAAIAATHPAEDEG